MKVTQIARHLALALLAAGLSLFPAQASRADTLTFEAAPAGNAVAEMSQKLGVGIVFRGNVDATRPVTFSIADADTPGGRLQAVSALADALGLRFQKVYVVSKIAPGAAVPEIQADSTGQVSFTANQVPAQDAIQTVAAADAATVQISSAISGDVTFPHTTLSVPDAAAEIARQTQTQWKVYYALYPRGEEPARLDGRVIDYTRSGQPIMELPLVTYVTPTPPAAAPAATETSAASQPVYNPYAYGFNPSAYGYGNAPYAVANPMNGMIADPNNGGVIPIQGGFGQPSIYTVPDTGLSFPPNYNGPIIYNGYGYNGY